MAFTLTTADEADVTVLRPASERDNAAAAHLNSHIVLGRTAPLGL